MLWFRGACKKQTWGLWVAQWAWPCWVMAGLLSCTRELPWRECMGSWNHLTCPVHPRDGHLGPWVPSQQGRGSAGLPHRSDLTQVQGRMGAFSPASRNSPHRPLPMVGPDLGENHHAPYQTGFLLMYASQKQVLRGELPPTLTSWATGLQGLRGGTSGVHVAKQFLSSWGAVTPVLLGPGSWRAAGGWLLSP